MYILYSLLYNTNVCKIERRIIKKKKKKKKKTFRLPSIRLSLDCNLIMKSYRDSLKTTSKWVKTQIQKGANPERAAKKGYERTCEYLEILDEGIHIQHRALTCQVSPYPTCSRGNFTPWVAPSSLDEENCPICNPVWERPDINN